MRIAAPTASLNHGRDIVPVRRAVGWCGSSTTASSSSWRRDDRCAALQASFNVSAASTIDPDGGPSRLAVRAHAASPNASPSRSRKRGDPRHRRTRASSRA